MEIGTTANGGLRVFNRTWVDGVPAVVSDLSRAYPGLASRTVWVYREGEGGEPGIVNAAYSSGGSGALSVGELVEVLRSLWR